MAKARGRSASRGPKKKVGGGAKGAHAPKRVAKKKVVAKPRARAAARAEGGKKAPKKRAKAPSPSREVTPTRPQGAHLVDATVVRRAGEGSDRVPVMELHWGEPISEAARVEGLIQRWVRRGELLLRKLAEQGIADHETRADLRDGRFVWMGPDGRVSAETTANVLCSWSKSTSVIAMGWANPLARSVAVARIDGMAAERDSIDEEAAWRVAMEAAEAAGAEYLYRVPTPHAWYFLALGKPTFTPSRPTLAPSTPVGFVLKSIVETRSAVESRAEPTQVLRLRIEGVGEAMMHEASYTYRGSDWVSRLERTGKCLLNLATRLPRPSYGAIAAGRAVDEWLDREAILDLAQSLSLIEDEWTLFA